MSYNGCDDYASHHIWEFVIHPGWSTGWHVCKRCERSVNCDCLHEKWAGGCKYYAAMNMEAQQAWVQQRVESRRERDPLYLPSGKLLTEGNSNE